MAWRTDRKPIAWVHSHTLAFSDCNNVVHVNACVRPNNPDEHHATLAKWVIVSMSLARFLVFVVVAVFVRGLLDWLAFAASLAGF